MAIRIDLSLTPEEEARLIGVAVIRGFKPTNPRRRLPRKERGEAIRFAVLALVKDKVAS